jgi:hypothetical protein
LRQHSSQRAAASTGPPRRLQGRRHQEVILISDDEEATVEEATAVEEAGPDWRGLLEELGARDRELRAGLLQLVNCRACGGPVSGPRPRCCPQVQRRRWLSHCAMRDRPVHQGHVQCEPCWGGNHRCQECLADLHTEPCYSQVTGYSLLEHVSTGVATSCPAQQCWCTAWCIPRRQVGSSVLAALGLEPGPLATGPAGLCR